MARQVIDLTTPQPGGRQGEPTASAWAKVNDMTAELYASPAMNGSLAGKNLLINCGPPINQRVFAGGALAAGVYGYDRWKAGVGGCNLTINATSGIYTHTSGAIQQIIENPAFAWGNPLTFSVENPSATLTVIVGNASGTITAGSGRRGVTLTPTGSGNMVAQITATSASYSRPQLELGTSATQFEYRSPAIELLLCQRYYEKSYSLGTTPATAAQAGRVGGGQSGVTGSNHYYTHQFKVQKRSSPVINIYNPGTGAGGGVANDVGTSVLTNLPYSSDSNFELQWQNAAGRYGGWFHYVAESEL